MIVERRRPRLRSSWSKTTLKTRRPKCERLLSFLQEFLRDLRQLLANLAGQPVMDASGLYARNVRHHHRRGSSHGHDQPYHAKEKKSCKSDEFQHQRVSRREMTYRAKG